MDVESEELSEAPGPRGDNTLDRLLGELEDEVESDPTPPPQAVAQRSRGARPKSSIPPPLPSKRRRSGRPP